MNRIPFAVRYAAREVGAYLKFAGHPTPCELPLQYATRSYTAGSHWVKLAWEGGLRFTANVEQGGRWTVTSVTIRMEQSSDTARTIFNLEEYTGELPKFSTELGRTIIIDGQQLGALQEAVRCTELGRQLPMKWADEDNQFRKAMEAEKERVR